MPIFSTADERVKKMEQLPLQSVSSPMRSNDIAVALRPFIDETLKPFNLSPRHVSIGVLKEREKEVGRSIFFSISQSVFAVGNEASSSARGSIVCRIKDQVRVSFVEFPANRAKYYTSIGEATAVGASEQCLRINLDANPDIPALATAICTDIEEYLRCFPSDISCCHLFEKCSDVGRCICDDQDLAVGCYYKRNLMRGKVFYGKRGERMGTPNYPLKGASLTRFPKDFTVIDLETTGMSSYYDEIIEFAALRIRDFQVVNQYSTLIKPNYPVSTFITSLTGITNAMLESAPPLQAVLDKIKDYIGNDIIVGHNVNFDIDFLYDRFEQYFNAPITNDFVDTLRLARKALPQMDHHRLCDLCAELKVAQKTSHRALADCETTLGCYLAIRNIVLSEMTEDEFSASFKRKWKSKDGFFAHYDLTKVTSENEEFDETHPLYKKKCVFTGILERMTRLEAAQLVANVGGIPENSVTKKTNYLVLGNNEYNPILQGNKSNKQKKAEEYKLAGCDIEIIPETVFYEMLEE